MSDKGEWLEKEVHGADEETGIVEWQSAKCSNCGKYHTTPYMYYFTHYDYCPNCGLKMGDMKDDMGKGSTSKDAEGPVRGV